MPKMTELAVQIAAIEPYSYTGHEIEEYRKQLHYYSLLYDYLQEYADGDEEFTNEQLASVILMLNMPGAELRIPVKLNVSPPVPPAEVVTDVDGNTYTYVTIGTQQWIVENLKTTKYKDGTPIPNIPENSGQTFNDWFLPSKDELNEMLLVLKGNGLGNFVGLYWCSSEVGDGEHSYVQSQATPFSDSTGAYKDHIYNALPARQTANVRACRTFTSTINYNLGDVGPAGGYIFWKSGNDYLESASSDCGVSAWSNIDNVVVGGLGTAIGTGYANTQAIINQCGNTGVVDVDGNYYASVIVGTQEWITENLKTTHYKDGTPIPNVTDETAWTDEDGTTNHDGAYSWYDNDMATNLDYGPLYNYWATLNPHGLIPEGWRLPTMLDFQALVTSFGGLISAGMAIKETGTSHWNSPNTGATNSSGLSVRASGQRSQFGPFAHKGIYGYLMGTDAVMYVGYTSPSATIERYTFISPWAYKFGASIRCVRDLVVSTNSAAKLCADLSIVGTLGWTEDTIGAYCWFNNDPNDKNLYGVMYNWYAVNNSHGLAIEGWRIPSNTDFNTLVTYLGGDSVAGGKLKEIGITHWNSPNIGAIDQYGFKGLPGGRRDNLGNYYNRPFSGDIWSSDKINTTDAYGKEMLYSSEELLSGGGYLKNFGVNVRLMRDLVDAPSQTENSYIVRDGLTILEDRIL